MQGQTLPPRDSCRPRTGDHIKWKQSHSCQSGKSRAPDVSLPYSPAVRRRLRDGRGRHRIPDEAPAGRLCDHGTERRRSCEFRAGFLPGRDSRTAAASRSPLRLLRLRPVRAGQEDGGLHAERLRQRGVAASRPRDRATDYARNALGQERPGAGRRDRGHQRIRHRPARSGAAAATAYAIAPAAGATGSAASRLGANSPLCANSRGHAGPQRGAHLLSQAPASATSALPVSTRRPAPISSRPSRNWAAIAWRAWCSICATIPAA